MKTKNTLPDGDESQHNGLREKLADNRKKLEALAKHIGEKNEELAMLKLEMEDLARQYTGNKG